MRKSTRNTKKKQQEQTKVSKQPEVNNKRAKQSKPQDDPQPKKKVKKDAEQPVSKTKSKQKIQQPAKSKTPEKAKDPSPEPELKKLVLVGKVPVDEIFKNIYGNDFHVLTDNGITYATTMNQSNISNNNNKFYIIQVLQNSKNANNYHFWSRWGRVGVQGQNANYGPIGKDLAIREYNKKLKDKSVKGDYRIVQMNYENEDEPETKKETKKESAKNPEKNQKTEYQQSSLPNKVKDLIRLIFDMKMVDNQMRQIGYDSKKMPLGKLAKSSILKGYQALKGLMDQINGKKRRNIIEQLSSDFYSDIPHDFGFQKMQNFILDTDKKVKAKLQMLQSIQDIQVFTKLLDQGKIANDINQLDSNYLKLNANIQPLERTTDEFKLLERYVKNTHAETHTAYHLQIQDIFKIKKQNQHQRYTNHIDNKMLLWHGSRLTNFVGIISQGLRIAPPQAPVTGYMFGKGVYFADMVTKSANYCFTNPANNTGLMLLCQVALGDMNEKYYADYYANLLPPGKMSTKGVGKNAPSSTQKLGDMIVPSGVGKPTNIANTSLLYNEFIVYDISQIRMRYLFRMKFVYNEK